MLLKVVYYASSASNFVKLCQKFLNYAHKMTTFLYINSEDNPEANNYNVQQVLRISLFHIHFIGLRQLAYLAIIIATFKVPS